MTEPRVTQERIKELANVTRVGVCDHSVPFDDRPVCLNCRNEAADALDKLAKVLERCEKLVYGEGDYFTGAQAERDAFSELLSSGPATAPPEPLCQKCGLPESQGHEFGFRDHAFKPATAPTEGVVG